MIKVEICCGTTCFMLGASELLRLEEIIPESWKNHLEIVAVPCLNACTSEGLGQAPFVRIDGQLVAHASPDDVLTRLQTMLAAKLEESDHE